MDLIMRYFALKTAWEIPAPIAIFLPIILIEWFVEYNYGWLPVIISLAVMIASVLLFTNMLKSSDAMADYDHKKLEEFLRKK